VIGRKILSVEASSGTKGRPARAQAPTKLFFKKI